MLKKICILAFAFVLLTGSAFAQDSHIQIRIGVQQKGNDTGIILDAIQKEQDLILTSGLFPSYAFTMAGAFPSFFTGDLPDLSKLTFVYSPDLPERMTAWADSLQAEKTMGFYAGDLFDTATVMRRGNCRLDELTGLLQEESIISGMMSIFLNIAGSAGYSNARAEYSVFDDGRFVSFTGTTGDATIFTVSFDFSMEGGYLAVFGTPGKGKNYYWKTETRSADENTLQIRTALYADEGKTGYRNAVKNTPVLQETWEAAVQQEERTIRFSGTATPGNGISAMNIQGVFTPEKTEKLNASLTFGEATEDRLTMSVRTDQAQLSTEGLKTILLETEKAVSEDDTALIIQEIFPNIMPFYLTLTQVLPETYRETLRNFLF